MNFTVVFLHVLSAIVWVGGMVAIRLAVHPSLLKISDDTVRIGRTLEILKRLFVVVVPFVVILLVTAILMALELKGSTLYSLVLFKEGIWTIMAINLGYMVYARSKAQSAFVANDLMRAKKLLAPLPKYLLPLNILLGIVGLWMGVTLRGF